jgi:hypothetical protein
VAAQQLALVDGQREIRLPREIEDRKALDDPREVLPFCARDTRYHDAGLLNGKRHGWAEGSDQVAQVNDRELLYPSGRHADLQVIAGSRLGGLCFGVHIQDETEAAQRG